MEFGWDLGFGVWGLGFRGLGFRGLGFRVFWGVGFTSWVGGALEFAKGVVLASCKTSRSNRFAQSLLCRLRKSYTGC